MAVGVRSVSIDDICRDLGISKKTFYVYYDSKDQLVEDFLLLYEQHMHQKVQKIIDRKSIIDIILNFVNLHKQRKDVRQIPTLVYDLKKYYPAQFADYMKLVRSNVQESITDILTKGKQENIFREDVDVAKTARIYAALHMFMIEKMLDQKDHPTIVPDTKYALNIFFRGLVSREGEERIIKQLGLKTSNNI